MSLDIRLHRDGRCVTPRNPPFVAAALLTTRTTTIRVDQLLTADRQATILRTLDHVGRILQAPSIRAYTQHLGLASANPQREMDQLLECSGVVAVHVSVGMLYAEPSVCVKSLSYFELLNTDHLYFLCLSLPLLFR